MTFVRIGLTPYQGGGVPTDRVKLIVVYLVHRKTPSHMFPAMTVYPYLCKSSRRNRCRSPFTSPSGTGFTVQGCRRTILNVNSGGTFGLRGRTHFTSSAYPITWLFAFSIEIFRPGSVMNWSITDRLAWPCQRHASTFVMLSPASLPSVMKTRLFSIMIQS